jgi:hypothetical protein
VKKDRLIARLMGDIEEMRDKIARLEARTP